MDSDKVVTGIIALLSAVIGVAIISALVGQGSNTANVITAGGTAFGNILKVALSPVGSSSLTGGVSLPSLPNL